MKYREHWARQALNPDALAALERQARIELLATHAHLCGLNRVTVDSG